MISTNSNNDNNNKKRKSIFLQQEEWEAKERVIRLADESKQRARQLHITLVNNAVKMQLGAKL
jgi:hypothetical protein